jgi:hypothetical protein
MDGDTRSLVLLSIALFVVFLPLAFSGDILAFTAPLIGAGGRVYKLPLLDGSLLLVVAAIVGRQARATGQWRVRWGWFAAGAVTMLVLDVVMVEWLPSDRGHQGIRWLHTLAYVVALGVALAGLFTANRPRAGPPPFRFLLPVLFGTLVALMAEGYYFDIEVPIGDLSRVIDPEFFVHAGHIIVILLVAVGLEAHFFESFSNHLVGRAATIVTVAILCLGEAFATIALIQSDGVPTTQAFRSLEYVAFIICLEACFVGITMILAALSLVASRGRAAASAHEARDDAE